MACPVQEAVSMLEGRRKTEHATQVLALVQVKAKQVN